MGLFGNNRKKSLWDTINGLQDDTYAPSNPTAEAMARPVADYQSDPSIGDVSGAPKKGFNWGRAALAFAGGPSVTEMFHRRDEEKLAQDKFDEQQSGIRAAQQSAYSWAKSQGYSDQDARALAVHPETVAAMVQANHAPQRFDSGGGSLFQDGKWTTAPRFDGDGNVSAPSVTQPGEQFRAPDLVQRGTKAIPVQPGGQVQIVDALTGRRPDQVGQQQPPAGGPQPGGPQPGAIEDGYRFRGGDPGDPSNWDKIGGASSGARGFLGRRRY